MAVKNIESSSVNLLSGLKRMLARDYTGSDFYFVMVLRVAGLVVIGAFLLLCVVMGREFLTSIGNFGLEFIYGTTWQQNAVGDREMKLGAGAFIFGTVITSILALLLAAPLAIGAGIFVSEYAPRWLGNLIGFAVEMLVTIPSVVYGLWGYFVLSRVLRDTVQPFLRDTFNGWPILGDIFSGPIQGLGMMTAGIILAIMILPTILSISREIINQVPRLQKEGMLALGATKWEMVRHAILPYARLGIFGGMMLGFARAFGETMAVTMVIGNAPSGRITTGLFNQGNTLASQIANQFQETSDPTLFSAIVGLGMILLIVAAIFNILSRLLVSFALRDAHNQ
jgi:phosphate transport system permease protein